MSKRILINPGSKIPVYKQLVSQIENNVKSGEYPDGYKLPSMNILSASLDISKETVKKAYSILRNLGFIDAKQGKGYYVSSESLNAKLKILLLFDKLSTYKQILFNSFIEKIGDSAEITIRMHSQNVDLLEYYLNENLDLYDYYVITPHFSLDAPTQKKVLKLLKRIPNRKLILVDRLMSDLPGNYGAVYQDFVNDIYDGLKQGLKTFKNYSKLNVVTLPSSLYAQSIKEGVERFCNDYSIPVENHSSITPEMIRPREAYLVLNSQLDFDLIKLVRLARAKKFKVGKDIGIISYNESPINEIILNGLTSVSTDFCQMGQLVAGMILERKLTKIKCDFHMIRRGTF